MDWVLLVWQLDGQAGPHAVVQAVPVQSRPMAQRPAVHRKPVPLEDCTHQWRRDDRKVMMSLIRRQWPMHVHRKEINLDRFRFTFIFELLNFVWKYLHFTCWGNICRRIFNPEMFRFALSSRQPSSTMIVVHGRCDWVMLIEVTVSSWQFIY